MVYKIQFLLLVFISAFLGILISIIHNNIVKEKQNIIKKGKNNGDSKKDIKLYNKFFDKSNKKNIQKNIFLI